ncbi:MAG: T9SS type A sorting domain-containing protein [Flavobacteriales bacterium]
MKRFYLLLCTLFISQFNFAQQGVATTTMNEFTFPMTSTGDLFHTNDQSFAGLSWSEMAIKTVFGGNLWIGGTTSDQQLRLAGELYSFPNFTDFFCGPLDMNGQSNNTEEINAYYNFVFFANQADIDTHIAYFDALENGTEDVDFPNGYTIPQWMFQWPAHLNPDLNILISPAPYRDENGDGNYDPEDGDYPMICGDKCLYMIFNDNGGVHTQSSGQPIGAEFHLMIYGFEDSNNPDLENTIFAHYEILNKGTQTLTDTYIGIWADYDLGNPQDDYLLTNVKRSAISVYNADATDENTAFGFGFGNDLGVFSTMILGGPFMDDDGEDNSLPDNTFSSETESYGNAALGFEDGIIDNERLGLAKSMKLFGQNSPITSLPVNATDYYNFLRGNWKNGQPLTHGNNGTGQGEIPNTNYYAPGIYDPLNTATGLEDQFEWTEEIGNNLPTDFSAMISTGPFTFQPSATHYLDIAFVLATESQDPDLTVLELMDERLKNIRLFFNENTCFENETILSTQNLEKDIINDISISPNPATTKALITSIEKIQSLQVFSITGTCIFKLDNLNASQFELDVTSFAPGLYLIKVNNETARLVIR